MVSIELLPVAEGTRVRITESPSVGHGVDLCGRGPTVTRSDQVFQALADPTRRTLLRALSEEGPSTLAQLSSHVSVTRQAVTKHLTILRDAGLVAGHGETRGRRYRLTPAPLADAMGWMVDVGAGWDDRLARLKHDVEDGRPPGGKA